MKTELKRSLIMKNFILVFAFLYIFVSACTNQQQLSSEEIEQTILALEKKALDSWAKGDPIGFSHNFSEDATYFDDIGAQIRLDGIEELKKYFETLKGKIPPHNYKISDSKIQVYSNIAILTLRYNTSSLDNEPSPPWKATSVYRLIGDKWQVVHANWSLIKEN
jgi:hypothetical protein